mgnify:FL=1
MKNTKWIKRAALFVAIVMCGFFGGIAFTGHLNLQKAAAAESVLAQDTALTSDQLESPFKAAYEKASQSVVGIKISTGTSISNGRISSQTAFVGSGVVVSDDSYVVTNNHVIESADSIYVVVGEEEYPAELVATDADSDVAVLLCKDLNVTPATLGNSDELSVGDWALVIGNPLGETFANTLTTGVISGLGRDVSSAGANTSVNNFIQTNAQINSGNSGGGLFNIAGELVGITSMKLSNNGYYGSAAIEGIGFAIPINTVKEVADDLIEYGERQYPAIGVNVSPIDSNTEEPTKDSLPKSIWVRSVEKNSPAAEAGIQANDLIVKADGKRITTVSELQSTIRSHEIGETVEITVYRIPNLTQIKVNEDIPDGEYLTFNVEVKVIK